MLIYRMERPSVVFVTDGPPGCGTWQSARPRRVSHPLIVHPLAHSSLAHRPRLLMLSCGARVHSQIYMAASSLTALRTSCSGNGTLGLRGTHGVLACCALACGKCGGEKCSDRPGGRSQCCALDVKRSDRVCDMHPPPCVPSLKSHMTVAQYVSSVDPGATAPQVVRNTPIYIEHIHKAGGTTVCKTLRISRGCTSLQFVDELQVRGIERAILAKCHEW